MEDAGGSQILPVLHRHHRGRPAAGYLQASGARHLRRCARCDVHSADGEVYQALQKVTRG